ncbi:phosphotransferase [Nocardioides perillae]|uniref:Spectinomycin phosphotransferase n=1 Tax=Nocardioides perillae TaxID=1119534 RepID=A0A7Y9RUH8_9ACTN|nr:phosphotransferase [Nocardioides perillae]NYG54797.1 spectinomycin phosphotransferase [Nocardioides perillae]
MRHLPPPVRDALAAGWAARGLDQDGAAAVELAGSPGSRRWRVTVGDTAYAVELGPPDSAGGLATALAAAAAGVPGVAAPVPTVDGTAHVAVAGRALSVVPWLDGVPAPEARLGRAHWVALGETLGRLHALPVDGLPPVPQPDPAALAARLEAVRRRVVATRTGGAALGALRDGLREHRRALDRATRVLLTPRADRPLVACHGDLHLRHVLLADDRPVLLGWWRAGAAARERDLERLTGDGLGVHVGSEEEAWLTRGYGRVLAPDPDELAWQRTLRLVEAVVGPAEVALAGAPDLGARLAAAGDATAALAALG